MSPCQRLVHLSISLSMMEFYNLPQADGDVGMFVGKGSVFGISAVKVFKVSRLTDHFGAGDTKITIGCQCVDWLDVRLIQSLLGEFYLGGIVPPVVIDPGQGHIVQGGTLAREIAMQIVYTLAMGLGALVAETHDTVHHGTGTGRRIQSVLAIMLLGIRPDLPSHVEPLTATDLPEDIKGLIAPCLIEQPLVAAPLGERLQTVGDSHELLHTVSTIIAVHRRRLPLYLGCQPILPVFRICCHRHGQQEDQRQQTMQPATI